MKSLNDARYKIEFDTGQIAEEIKIPNGNGINRTGWNP